jgi:hypothetical protein
LGKSHFTLTVLVNVRGDGAEYAVAECRRTARAQRLAGGSRRLRGTVIDRGGVNLRAEESDTREPTVCLPAGAISAETRADLNNYERNENSQDGARKERVRGEGARRRTR